ncbi:MAG: hypothetical protein V4519_03460 [Patescibacteria group bacterium]
MSEEMKNMGGAAEIDNDAERKISEAEGKDVIGKIDLAPSDDIGTVDDINAPVGNNPWKIENEESDEEAGPAEKVA